MPKWTVKWSTIHTTVIEAEDVDKVLDKWLNKDYDEDSEVEDVRSFNVKEFKDES